jgi:protein-S-isoprenylcysteine O-methyltransferase Ste14
MPGVSPPERGARARSLRGLIQDLNRDVRALLRGELALAAAELRQKSTRLTAGIGMMVAAAVLIVIALGVLTAAFVMGLAEFMPGWLAGLIVTLVLVVIAAGLVLAGRRSLARGSPPLPQETLESAKEDVTWIRNRARSGLR